MTHRRKRNTGTVYRRGSKWIALAPQHARGQKQFVVARNESKTIVEAALYAWLNTAGRILRKAIGAKKRARRPVQ